ncbi:MAG: hypothetical protein K5838_02310 [Elusimicrobiales bacterium]|nr:hypothetical protein [Elusimicrobiales bacterium]
MSKNFISRSSCASSFIAFKKAVSCFDASEEALSLVDSLSCLFDDEFNHTFDLSVVSNDNNMPVRFSVNDSSCRGKLLPFAEAYISCSDTNTDLSLLKSFSSLVLSFGNDVQFTLGVQWDKKSKFPVLKAYFEDGSPVYEIFFNDSKRKKLFDMFSLPDMKVPSRDIPSIICADLRPDGSSDLKFYVKKNAVHALAPYVKDRNSLILPKCYSESVPFYYYMEGLISGRKKLYMAYPADMATDSRNNIVEACRLFSSMRAVQVLKKIKNWNHIAIEENCLLIPTLFSYSLDDRNIPDKASLYCHFLKKNKYE